MRPVALLVCRQIIVQVVEASILPSRLEVLIGVRKESIELCGLAQL